MAITPRRSERAKRSMSGQWTSTTHGPREKVPLPKELARCGQPYMNFNPGRSFLFGGGWSKSNQSRIWRPILEPPLASPTLQGVYIPRAVQTVSQNPLPRGEIAIEPNYMSPEEWAKADLRPDCHPVCIYSGALPTCLMVCWGRPSPPRVCYQAPFP